MSMYINLRVKLWIYLILESLKTNYRFLIFYTGELDHMWHDNVHWITRLNNDSDDVNINN